MSKRILPLLIVTLTALASGFTLHAAAAGSGDGNRLVASFSESAQSITNRISDLGTLQLITTGTGSVAGFGSGTVVVAISEERSVAPCGPGSSTNAATRRIVLSAGVLVLRELSIACPTASGAVITGSYEIDGLSSSGVFAGAWGSGEVTVNTTTHTSTLSGKLHLANSDG